MAFYDWTIEASEAEAFFRGEREQGVIDLALQPSPFLQMILGSSAKTGSRQFDTDWNQLKDGSFDGDMKNDTTSFWVEKAYNMLPMINSVTGSGVQVINNTPVNNTTLARWELTRKYQPVGISEDEYAACEAKSGGSKGAALVGLGNLLANKAAIAMETMVVEMATDLFGSNTSHETGYLSLGAGIGQTSPDTSTYGSITRAATGWQSNWLGNYNSAAAATITDPSSSAFVLTRFGRMVQTVLNNGAQVSDLMFVVGSTVYAAYNDAISGNTTGVDRTSPYRININNGDGIPGWTGLSYSNIPITQDIHCDASSAFLIDMRYTGWNGMKNNLFASSKWVPAEASTLYYTRYRSIGQFLVKYPRRNYHQVWA